MGRFGGMTMTTKGLALQAKAQAGAELIFSRVKVGDGALSGSIPAMNDVIAEKASLDITGCSVASGVARVSAFLSNTGLATGYYWREIGVFATDPDIGEILYSYGNAAELADYVPAAGGADVFERFVSIKTAVGTAANVSANVSTEAYATQEAFDEHADDSTIHVAKDGTLQTGLSSQMVNGIYIRNNSGSLEWSADNATWNAMGGSNGFEFGLPLF